MNVLIFSDAHTSATLRHEVPVDIGDPFLYIESGERRIVVTNALEDERLAREAPELERILVESLGRDELLAEGRSWNEVDRELCVRATASLRIRDAVVPPDFPIALADRLRGEGLTLRPDEDLFIERRRHKTAQELAGIRRAADAAIAAIREAATMLREASIDSDRLVLNGELVSSETVRARIREVCDRAGCPAPPDIMVKPMGPSPQIGHDPGAGPLPPHTPIEIDLWPRDERSGCYADMTRTFVRGEISDEIAKVHELVLDAHERSCGAIKPGLTGREVYALACDVFEAADHPTQRTKTPGETLRHGFYFSLGHGVGLEVHEPPVLGRAGNADLIEGDVLAVEPGTVVPGVGGTRVEDLLLVTESGSERLTAAFPYGLTP